MEKEYTIYLNATNCYISRAEERVFIKMLNRDNCTLLEYSEDEFETFYLTRIWPRMMSDSNSLIGVPIVFNRVNHGISVNYVLNQPDQIREFTKLAYEFMKK